uniref:Uncharacterized protein n=1 Tax=Mesocestoides corti TaxID=53468 RepID=A0A5K3FMT0_MESCO
MSRSTTQRSYLKDIHQFHRMSETSTNDQASTIFINEMSTAVFLPPKSDYKAHADYTVEMRAC